MSTPAIDRMLAEHQAAIARQEAPITHATICDILAHLAAEQITPSQAIRLLEQTAERVTYAPERAALYRRAIADLRQAIQGEEAAE